MSSDKDGSGGYARDKRHMLGLAGTVLAGIAIGIGGWAHAILWAHGQSIVRLETNRENDQKQSDKLEQKVDEILRKLEDLRDRLPKPISTRGD